MEPPDTHILFAAGMARAVQHWLAFWQQAGHDIEAEYQTCRHALRALMWCVEWKQQPAATVDLALALQSHMIFRADWHIWEACLREVLAHMGSQIEDERRYELQYCLAVLCFRLHRLDEAVALAQDNERLALAAGDLRRQERVATLLAETYLNMGRYDTALAYAERAIKLATALGVPAWEADGHIDVARALLGLGRIDEAEEHLATADRLASAAQDLVYQCKAKLFLGHAAAARRDWQRSLACCTEALDLVQSYGDHAGRGVVLGNIGRALLELGRWDEAEVVLTEALRVHQFHGNAPAERVTRQRLAELAARRSDA